MMRNAATLLALLLPTHRSVAFLGSILSARHNGKTMLSPCRSRRPAPNHSRVPSLPQGFSRQTICSSIASSSLASEYAIRINPFTTVSHENDLGSDAFTSVWELYSIQNWESSGSSVPDLCALKDCAESNSIHSAEGNLSCHVEGPYENQWYIEIDVDANNVSKELICVLSRIMVQSVASHITSLNHSSLLQLKLPTLRGETFQEFQCSQLAPSETEGNDMAIRQLFQPLNSDYASMEIVDMVNQNGDILGSLPRPFIHTYNILHRGIGMIVSRDVSILDKGNVPDVYVHQRTDTKRIFPSLYDMFVGGVSSRGETAELTAAREVAEELGLRDALNYQQGLVSFNPLSSKLFQCTICTAYNRCVVSMFAYQCLTDVERIRWQKEEVQWGEYVPYEVVELAAKLSIDRLTDNGSWPGVTNPNNVNEMRQSQMNELVQSSKEEYNYHQTWESWNFVPDGLLVWEAWVQWFKKSDI